jgi:hypothetical protein
VTGRSYLIVQDVLLLIQRADSSDVRSVVSVVISPGTKSCV